MKILFYGDTHLRETSSFPPYNRVQNNGLTGELNNILTAIDFVKDSILDLEPDLVINLGDTYHKDNLLSPRTLYSATLAMSTIHKACKKLDIDHLIIAGNHDIYGILEDGTKITSICTLAGYGIIVNESIKYKLGDFTIYTVPYTDSIEEAYQEITQANDCDLIATHLEFLGAVHDNGHPVEHGLDSRTNVPVICGHIHLPQIVGNVWMPGSILQGRFSRFNLDEVGGVLLYDTDTDDKSLIQNNRSKHFVKVRDLNMLNCLDPERCILKIFSDVPEEDIKDSLQDFEYMYITIKTQEDISTSSTIRHEIEKPETLLRAYIQEERPELVGLYDEVIK